MICRIDRCSRPLVSEYLDPIRDGGSVHSKDVGKRLWTRIGVVHLIDRPHDLIDTIGVGDIRSVGATHVLARGRDNRFEIGHVLDLHLDTIETGGDRSVTSELTGDYLVDVRIVR